MFPDFWLQPVLHESAAFAHATRAVALHLGSVASSAWLATMEAHADGWYFVRVAVGELAYFVRVAEEGAWAEVIEAVAAEAARAA